MEKIEYKIQDSILVSQNIEIIKENLEALILDIKGKTTLNQTDSLLWVYKYAFQTIRCKTYLVSNEENTEIIIMVDNDYIGLPGSKKIITDFKKALLNSKIKILTTTTKNPQKTSLTKTKITSTPSISKNKKTTRTPKKKEISTQNFIESNFIVIGIVAIFIISILIMTQSSSGEISSNSKIVNSPWDSSVYQVEIYLKHNLNDPDSYQSIEWGYVDKINDDDYRVRHKYRVKNEYGGYIVKNQIFRLNSNGDVVKVFPPL